MVKDRPGDAAETPPWTLTLGRAESTSEWLTTPLPLVIKD